MTAGEAALLAMVVNLGAYSTGSSAPASVTPKGQWEAGRVLGLRPDANLRSRRYCPRRCSGFIRRWSASASL